jgi:hypothetical protein
MSSILDVHVYRAHLAMLQTKVTMDILQSNIGHLEYAIARFVYVHLAIVL